MEDFTSLVPKYTFPDALEEQEAALAANPLMQRLIEARASYAGDPHRPIYHYVNPEAMLNDPNGLCYWQGRWHLFYQAYPPEDPRQHWGHAIPEDLVHWRDLPYCIYPNPESKCFSGAALVEEDRVIAMYHGTDAGNMVAVSSDPLLLNWKKVADKAVIPLQDPDGPALPYRVFDPCIWKKDGRYYSLSAGTKAEGPAGKPVRANFLFKSEDLEHWTYLHAFVEDDAFTLVGDDGACPYFWPIGERHILLFFSHMSGGQYLLGDYAKERDKFVVTHGGKFNFGPSTPAGVHAHCFLQGSRFFRSGFWRQSPPEPDRHRFFLFLLRSRRAFARPRNRARLDRSERGARTAGVRGQERRRSLCQRQAVRRRAGLPGSP